MPLSRPPNIRSLGSLRLKILRVSPFSVRHSSCAVPFDWEDPFNLTRSLTEEEVAIQQTARSYCQERLLPRVTEAYRNENYDPKIIQEMGELGLLGANIEGYGCAGSSNVATGLITREVERVDSGYRSGMSVQSSLVMSGIHEFGSEEQKQRFLPLLASGKLLGCFGLTEPNHGSDPGSLETVAKKHPTKSGGFIVERKDVPRGTLETPALKSKLGLRASVTGMIHLDNCPVPKANLLPDIEGLKGPFTCLNSARLGIAWGGAIGALEDSISRARTYALERKQFRGNPLAKYQLVQKKLADAVTEAAYGLQAAWNASRMKDEGLLTPEVISMIKRQNCDKALGHTRKLQEIFGGNAISDEYHIGRYVANLFVVQTYEGQSDIHSLILGRALTGVQAFC